MNKVKSAVFLFLCFFAISCSSIKETSIKEAKTESLKVMSYNILHETSREKENMKWSERKSYVVGILKKYKPDVLCAQEDRLKQGEYLMAETGLIKVGVTSDGTTTSDGSYRAIYYDSNRLLLKDKGHFWLSETPDVVMSKGWDAIGVRMCNWAFFEDRNTKQKFYVFNAHFDPKGVEAKLNSAILILKKVNEIAKGEAFVFAGDLNSFPGTAPMQVLEAELLNTYKESLTAPKGPKGSFSGIKGSIPFKRVDYIFVEKFKTLEFETIDDRRADGIHPSDHCPIMAILKQEK